MKLLLCALLFCNIATAQEPNIKVLDTDFSKGRLKKAQNISLNDLANFHGHLCDGLALGFLGLREMLYMLYPNHIVDRTNTRIVSKSSPCLTDVAIYLTGGRYQYNTFYVSDSIKHLYIVQKTDNGKAYGVNLKPHIKPHTIDSLGAVAVAGKLDECGINTLQLLEENFTTYLLSADPAKIFEIEEIENFKWNPQFSNSFIKTDVINKNKKECK